MKQVASLVLLAFIAGAAPAIAQSPAPILARLDDVPVGNGPHSVVDLGPISPLANDLRPGLAVANSGENDPDGGGQCIPGQDTISILYQATSATGSFAPFTDGAINARVVDEGPVALATGNWRSASAQLDFVSANKCKDSLSVLIYRPQNGLRYIQPSNGGSPIRVPLPPGAEAVRPVAVAAGELNADGAQDFVAVYNGLGQAQVYLGRGDASFEPGAIINLPKAPIGAALGQFSADANLDLVVATQGDLVTEAGGGVTLVYGDNTGTFTGGTQAVKTGLGARSVAVADFNADGRSDAVVANQLDDSITVLLRRPSGDGFVSAERLSTNGSLGCPIARNGRRACLDQPSFVTVADFNRDERPDVIALAATSNTLLVFSGVASAPFFAAPVRIPLAGCVRPISAATPDLDGDNDPDLVIACLQSNRLALLRNDTP